MFSNIFFPFHADDLEMAAPPSDQSDVTLLQNGSLEQHDEEEQKNEDGCEQVGAKMHSSVEEHCKLEEEKQRQKKYTRLCRLRRRRCARKDTQGEDESDLSEGFESEDEEDADDERRGGSDSTGGTTTAMLDNPPVRKETKRDQLQGEPCWESRSEEEEEEEEGGTAFDVETESDMNSQESRSDLEMEDTENSDNLESHMREHHDEEENEDQPKEDGGNRDGDMPPTPNGPHVPSDSSISSNLQAMSSQLFQAKRCFRLAPTFSNMLLRPQASSYSVNPPPDDTSAPPSQETPPPPPGESPSDVNAGTANGTNENGTVLYASFLFFIFVMNLVIRDIFLLVSY